MFIAALGYLADFTGNFAFRNIGDPYPLSVPIVALRLSSAIPGTLLIPLTFAILVKMGHGELAAMLTASMLFFDNGLFVLSRFMMLDCFLMFWIFMVVYCWVSFQAKKAKPFSLDWWLYLLGTGISLSCATATKFVGLFAVALIGLSTLHDMWRLLDWKNHVTLDQLAKHFAARLLCLVAVPIGLYLAIFYLHFQILHTSGPGDVMMSPSFQATLDRNPISLYPRTIAYDSMVVLRHDGTFFYLNSQVGENSKTRYPIYPASTQGEDSWWMILPADETPKNSETMAFVKNGDMVRLKHVHSKAFLFADDTSSRRAQAGTDLSGERARSPSTLWKVEIMRAAPDQKLQVLSNSIRLYHPATESYLICNVKVNTEVGSETLALGITKDKTSESITWTIESHLNDRLNQFVEYAPPATFLEKFYETHEKMYLHNKYLNEPHHYESRPITWPFLIKGVRFWQGNNHDQIFLLGNPFVWGAAFYCGIIVFVVLWGTIQIREQRGFKTFDTETQTRFLSSGSFFFMGWVLHYAPFFFMDRTLYLHHYFPALIFSVLLAGVVIDYIMDCVDDSDAQTYTAFALMALFVFGHYYFSSLSMGSRSTKEDLQSLQWLQSWDFSLRK